MFTPPAEVSAVLAAFAPLFTSAQLAPRASPTVRRAAGSGQPHRHRRAPRLGAGRRARLPEFPSSAQSGPLVGPPCGRRATRSFGGSLCARRSGDRRLGRHHRAPARPVTVITRLRLDAALYRPAPVRRPGQNGRPRLKGKRLPSLARRLAHARTPWQTCQLAWYGGQIRRLQLATATAVWYSPGKPP